MGLRARRAGTGAPGDWPLAPDSPYLDDIRYALAVLFDIAVNECRLGGQDVADAFVVSGLAHEFERQNPVFVSGKSGIELVEFLLPFLGESVGLADSYDLLGRRPDYWLGWSLGFYQAATGVPYRRIFCSVAYRELVGMYHPLHEASEERFVETLNERVFPRAAAASGVRGAAGEPTPLRRYRERAGLSQAELARESGAGLRSIQMYEQRNRDIGRARAEDVLRMARVLGCDVADLVEA